MVAYHYAALKEIHHSLQLTQGPPWNMGEAEAWNGPIRKHFQSSEKAEYWIRFGWGKIKDSIIKKGNKRG